MISLVPFSHFNNLTLTAAVALGSTLLLLRPSTNSWFSECLSELLCWIFTLACLIIDRLSTEQSESDDQPQNALPGYLPGLLAIGLVGSTIARSATDVVWICVSDSECTTYWMACAEGGGLSLF